MTGLVMPHDSCGSHLDPSGEAVHPGLEKKNFKIAGKILSQIQKGLVLKWLVEIELIKTAGYDEHWLFKPCRISQYMLQVIQLSS